jgi:hypothetical protein
MTASLNGRQISREVPRAGSLPGSLLRACAVAFGCPFGELQQKGLGRRHAAFDTVSTTRLPHPCSGLNRPWLQEKMSPIGANIRTVGIGCRDAKKHKCSPAGDGEMTSEEDDAEDIEVGYQRPPRSRVCGAASQMAIGVPPQGA